MFSSEKNRQQRHRSISVSPERPSKYKQSKYQSPIRNGRDTRTIDRKHKRPYERTEKHRETRYSDKHLRRSRSHSASDDSPERTLKQRHRNNSHLPQRHKTKQRYNDDRKHRRSPSPSYKRRSGSPETKKSRIHDSARRQSPARRKRSPSPRSNGRHRGSAVTK